MKIKEALILAGGRGLRLIPITKDKYPKPLVEIGKHVSVLEDMIGSLEGVGIEKINIAVGHQKEKIISKVKKPNVTFIKEDSLLGTGGAIYNFIIKNNQKNPFLVTPADHYLDWAKLKSLINIRKEDLDKTTAIWFTTKYDSKVIQPGVKKNIWFNKKTMEIVEYLSGVPYGVIGGIKRKYSKTKNLYQNVTSIGILAINPLRFVKSVKKLKLTPPFCLYRDVAPLWIYGKSWQREKIKVKVANTDLIDIGTPERLFFVRRLYKFNQIGKPLIIAHKGMVSANSVPNSIKSLENSVNLKADGVEMDVHLTKDSILVVSHHHYLTTKFKTNVLIEASNFNELKTIEGKLVSLREVLALFKNKNIKVVLDVKTIGFRCVEKIIQEIINYQKNIIFEITAKEPLFLRQVKNDCPNVQTGLIIDESSFEPWMAGDYISYYLLNIGEMSGVDYLHLPPRILDLNNISAFLHKKGFKLHLNVVSHMDLEIAKRRFIDQLTTEDLVKTTKFFK